MRILFFIRQSTDRPIEWIGIMHLASILKKQGYEARLLKTGGLNITQITKRLKDYHPDIIAYSAMTGAHKYYIDLNKRLKEHFDCLSVFGGPHPTFFPEMVKEDGVDIICRGEGELALLELVERLEQKKPINDIKNLWIKDNNKVWKNPLRDFIDDLDKLPFPDREFMYENDRRLRDYKVKTFIAGRGCRYNCSYCFNYRYNQLYKDKGRILRRRSVDNFIREIAETKERYPLECVDILDDTFLLVSQNWLQEFAQKFREKIGLPFRCFVRADLINHKIVKILKDAACYCVWMGVECGNEKINNDLLKRALTNNQILNACRLLRKSGIRYSTLNILGLPVENPLEVDFETLKLNITCKPHFVFTTLCFPYPQTPLADYSMEKGYFSADNFSNMPENYQFISPLRFDNESIKKRVERFQKLFGITVEYPFLLPLVKFLIRFPFDGLFRYIRIFWHWFCYETRGKPRKARNTLFNILRLSFSFICYSKGLNKKIRN